MAGDLHAFWRGPIRDPAQARKIVSYTAGTFAAFAAAAVVTTIPPARLNPMMLVAAVVFAVPALTLLRTRSPIAAWVLFAISAYAVLGATALAVYLVGQGQARPMAFAVVLALFWSVPAVAAYRAAKAARYLRTDRQA